MSHKCSTYILLATKNSNDVCVHVYVLRCAMRVYISALSHKIISTRRAEKELKVY